MWRGVSNGSQLAVEFLRGISKNKTDFHRAFEWKHSRWQERYINSNGASSETIFDGAPE
jgi:hypothetical protein